MPPEANPLSFLSNSGLEEHEPTPPKKDEQQPPKKEDQQTPPPSKNKDQQFKELKLAKEKAEKEAEELKKQLDELKEISPLKPVAEYLKTKVGKVDEEAVNSFIEKQKERKKKLVETERAYQEKEEVVKSLSIERSDEWRKDYIEPLAKERNNLIAMVASIDNEGKIRHPQLIEGLVNQLTMVSKDGKHLDAIEIKKVLTQFEKIYKQKTGEDWDGTNLNEVAKTVESIAGKIIKANVARSNWAKTLEEREKERLFNEEKAREELAKKEIAANEYVTRKLISEFDFSQLEGIIPEEEFTEELIQQNKYITGIRTGDKSSKPKEYKELVVEMAKAKNFDKLLAKIREQEQEIEKLKEINKGGIGSGGGGTPPKREPKKVAQSSDPLSFLSS